MMFWAKVKLAAVVAGLVAAVGTGGGFAVKHLAASGGEPVKAEAPPVAPAPTPAPAAESPLAKLPSAPGLHIEKIKAMADNGWHNLGAPTGDPKWGSPRGCSWGGRSIVFSPDLRGAFRTGEGVHASVKKNGFGQDDYWFYDINGNRWICLYPGTDVKGFNDAVKTGALKVDINGQAVDRTNQPIPGHQFIHAWGNLTYDTDLKKFVMMTAGGFGRYFMPGLKDIDEGLKTLEGQGLNKAGPIFGPWAYNVATGRFERELATNKHVVTTRGATATGFPCTFYIGAQKEYFVGSASGVSFFNPATRTWRDVASPGAGPANYDFGGCVDAKRGRVYMGNAGDNFFYFDLAAGKWNKIANPNGHKFNFSSNFASVCHDSVNDVILVFDFASTQSVYVFEPGTNRWTDVRPFDGEFKKRVPRLTNCAVYDTELGVHFIYSAGDSCDDGLMGVYKFKKSDEKPAVDKQK